jgi:hypothetical protein
MKFNILNKNKQHAHMSQPDFTTVCENLLNAHPSILLYTCSNSSLSEEMFMNADIYTHHKTFISPSPSFLLCSLSAND